MKINGKNIIITGASSGIGLTILNRLSNYENVRIIAVARNIEKIPEKSGVIFPYSADMSSPEKIDGLFDYAEKTFGAIDIFISNAGFAYLEKLGTPDWNHIESIFNLNTLSPIYSLQKLMQQSGTNKKYFVSISSGVAVVPLPYYSLYCSTKSAIKGFMDTYRYEEDKNIHTMTVFPVATKTDFFKKASSNEKPILPFLTQEPDAVANAIIKGIEGNKRKVYPSLLFRLFYGIGHVFPFIFRVYSWNEKKKLDKASESGKTNK